MCGGVLEIVCMGSSDGSMKFVREVPLYGMRKHAEFF